MQKKIKKQVLAIGGFVVVFGTMIWFGYKNFVNLETKTVAATYGLNNKLPVAETHKELNKLEQYIQAEKDSLARKQQQANDPYSKVPGKQETRKQDARPTSSRSKEFIPTHKLIESNTRLIDPIKQVRKRPDFEIQYPLSEKPPKKIEQENITHPLEPVPLKREGSGVAGRGINAVDPSLQQLEGMLDKLIEIQHPEISKERDKKIDKNLDTGSKQNIVKSSVGNQTIQAVVHNTQIISSGATIKLRLVQNIQINSGGSSVTIPKGSFLYGISSISNERLTIQLTNIPFNNQVIPVSLSVFDMDGIEGIYIPGAIERDVSKEGADRAIQSFNLNSLNSSIAGQAAGAGMQATKALLSKKVKLIRVTVKAGHHVLLQNKMGY